MLTAMLPSVIAGLATCLGGLAVILWGKVSRRSMAVFLGLAVGIMFAVVVFDLIPSALDEGGFRDTLTGFVLGAGLIKGLESLAARFTLGKGAQRYLLNLGYLIATGIALHDIPEGMAIAAAYAAGNRLGITIALGIGLHNIPEGMATAAPLLLGGAPVWGILGLNLLVSFFTPLGTLLGLAFLNFLPAYAGEILALAAGAMAYIVVMELWPEVRRRNLRYGLSGIIAGMAVALFAGIIS